MKMYSVNRLWKKSLFPILILMLNLAASAQSIDDWYAHAQDRIDTLRKGTFGFKVVDRNGQPFTGDVSVRMLNHEFPFGIAFDLYEGDVNYGNAYTTTTTVSAPADAEIYMTERWYSFMAYSIPVDKDRNYKITLKFAEIYFDVAGSRKFNVFVEGTKFLSDYDVFAAAGGKNKACDTSIVIDPADSLLNIELVAIKDNAAIKGIEIQTVEGDWITRINCGGPTMTTSSGHAYVSDSAYFDKNASRYPSEEQWAKAAMQKYFNYGVSGNSFKWSGIQPTHTLPNYTDFDRAVSWTQSIGWELRAHTLLWGGPSYESDHELPRWVKDLPTPQAITDTCKLRVTREVKRYKGIIKEYDVMNEPLHAKYLSSVVGDSINWNCFKWAHAADPDAKLFINDYNVEYNWGDAVKYRDLILQIKQMGGPVMGVGMQAHFWDGMRPNITELVTQINIVAQAGLPIKFTEFDNGNISEQAQAEDFIKVMKIAFSHPSINGMICWGLSDKGAWREQSGLFDENHKPKLAADTLLYYTRKLWATNFDTTSAGVDPVMFNAYYGTYSIEVKFGDTIKVFTIPCKQVNEDSVFVLYEADAAIKGPELLTASLVSDSTLKLDFTKPLKAGSLVSGDFRFFSDHLIRIRKIDFEEADSSTVIVSIDGLVSPADFICVSYFPGSLSSADGGKASAFGPVTVKNLTSGLLSASVTNEGTTVEAVFSSVVRNLAANQSSFILTDNGTPVSIGLIEYSANDSSIVILHPSVSLTVSSKPTLRYTQGTLVAASGFVCQSSAAITVSNIWPKILNASVTNSGNKITALFGTLLKNVSDNLNAFTITVEGQPIEISSISESGNDSTILTFQLASIIAGGQVVTISYEPGTVKGFNNNSLAAFENFEVTNNSTVSGINNAVENALSVFPNPTSGSIHITWNKEITQVVLLNTEGKEILRQNCSATEMSMSLPAELEPGIYFLQVQSKEENVNEKIIVR